MFGEKLLLAYDKDEISGLSARRESIWQRIENVSFMTINEKREAIGFAPLDGCDVLDKNGPKL
jgi:phage portal protein BeeE